MKQYKQFQPLVLSAFKAGGWQHPVHRHNHYELIDIKSGTGIHHIGAHELTYHEGSIF